MGKFNQLLLLPSPRAHVVCRGTSYLALAVDLGSYVLPFHIGILGG